MALVRAHDGSLLLGVAGALVALAAVWAAAKLDVFLPSMFAVRLARHPEALAAVLERLRSDPRRVAATTDRTEWLWCEAVERAVATAGNSEVGAGKQLLAKAGRANVRIDDELARRAEFARATAAGLSPREGSDRSDHS